MDFSRKGVEKKRKDLKSIKKRLNSKLWIWVFRFTIFAVVAVGICGVMAGFGGIKAIVDNVPPVAIDRLEAKGYISTAYYADGTVAQLFAGAEANRDPVPLSRIPIDVQHAFVALEDARFYTHGGIDIRGLMRTGYSVFRTGGDFSSGASTITQQLIKNQIFEGGRENSIVDKVVRKIQEQYIAINLEHVMSKDDILEYYMNLVNLGNGCYGIQTAAKGYFGKDVEELTISEAAVIAAIALSPTRENPILHPDINAKRRASCLENMYTYGFISKEQYDDALNDDVYTRIADYQKNKVDTTIGTYSYFTDSMLDQLYTDLQEKCGYTYEEAKDLIFKGGISIYTTQDPEIQKIMDSYYTDESNFPKFGFTSSTGSCYELNKDFAVSVYHADDTITHYHRNDLFRYYEDYYDTDGLYYHKEGGKKGISELFLSLDDMNAKIDEFIASVSTPEEIVVTSRGITPQPQSSMTIIEQSTGKVVGIYGGRGVKTQSLSLNRAYDKRSARSAGSTFKVLASFMPALDAGGLTLASVQDDSPFFYPGSSKEVINWYGRTSFRGIQCIRTGIANSLNVVAVKTLNQIGAEVGFDYLERLGISTLVKYEKTDDGRTFSDVNLTIALGGLTHGVTNIDMTAAYAAIANEGVYLKPIFYTKVLDHDGNVIIDNTIRQERRTVMKTSTAWLITDAMWDTTTVGTGSRLRFKNYKMPVAGKTGTASKNNDLWFAGFTPYYTCAVWTGYDNGFNQLNKSYQQDLWRNIMEDIHAKKQLEYKEWEKPSSIVEATICTKCGNLAISGLCDEYEEGNCIRTEYFARGTVPTKKCTCHVRVNICSKSGQIACANCPAKRVKSAVLLIKNEDYSKYDGYPGYSGKCDVGTWDTPYVYKPDEICRVHSGKKQAVEDDDEDVSDEDLFGEKHEMGQEDDVFDESEPDDD